MNRRCIGAVSYPIGIAHGAHADLTEAGDPQKDVVQPRLVQALSGRPVLRVSCGYAHTGVCMHVLLKCVWIGVCACVFNIRAVMSGK